MNCWLAPLVSVRWRICVVFWEILFVDVLSRHNIPFKMPTKLLKLKLSGKTNKTYDARTALWCVTRGGGGVHSIEVHTGGIDRERKRGRESDRNWMICVWNWWGFCRKWFAKSLEKKPTGKIFTFIEYMKKVTRVSFLLFER